MEMIMWYDHMRNEVVFHRHKQGRNILHTMKRRRLIGLVKSAVRNCLIKHVIVGKIELMR
jgi:hypothetical protein